MKREDWKRDAYGPHVTFHVFTFQNLSVAICGELILDVLCGSAVRIGRRIDLMGHRPKNAPLDLSAVPIFPLPNVVLFPHVILPLHIFEERYKQMTADALTGPRQIAMALLKPGWEKDYYQRPGIEPVVCVGTIVSHEMMPDGKYNF